VQIEADTDIYFLQIFTADNCFMLASLKIHDRQQKSTTYFP